MNTNYLRLLGFDLETSLIPSLPDGSPDNDFDRGKLAIYCAALVPYMDGERKRAHIFRGQDREMQESELDYLVESIARYVDDGFLVVAHNGVSFDLQVLYALTGAKILADIALHHTIDQCFNCAWANGYPVGLGAIAHAYKLSGKTEGMDGSKVESMWGYSIDDDATVLEYVEQDSWLGVQAVIAHAELGDFRWTSRAGRSMRNNRGGRNSFIKSLDTPMMAMSAYFPPDVSWMKKPFDKDSMWRWAREVLALKG